MRILERRADAAFQDVAITEEQIAEVVGFVNEKV
jgi:hypothetical protein